MTVEQVIRSYSMGRGTAWMYQKRTEGLINLKLTELRGDKVVVTAAGQRIARRLAWLRSFLRVDF